MLSAVNGIGTREQLALLVPMPARQHEVSRSALKWTTVTAHDMSSGKLTTTRVALTVRCQRKMGVTPISRARFAQVVGPTCALTAAFKTRVGRCGYDELTYSVANRPRSELPRVAREAFVLGRGWSGCCWLCSETNDECTQYARLLKKMT